MNECVLVVDDDREIVRAIALLLEKEGYQIQKAYDGMEALRIIAEQSVQLIIMDVMMPKLDGLSAMMKIRERKNLPIMCPSPSIHRNWLPVSKAICADIHVWEIFIPVIRRMRSGMEGSVTGCRNVCCMPMGSP